MFAITPYQITCGDNSINLLTFYGFIYFSVFGMASNRIDTDNVTLCDHNNLCGGERLQSVSWILAEFYFNRGLQRLYTGTCIILQKTINGFLCLLIVFLKSKTYQLILKDVIKLNRNLR